MNTQVVRIITLVFLGLSIVFAGFTQVVPVWLGPYFAAGSAVCTGLAGLFLHPPGSIPGENGSNVVNLPKPTVVENSNAKT